MALNRAFKASRERMVIVYHNEDSHRATFRVLGASGRLYNITMSCEGFTCSCPDFAYHGPAHCKHILHVILRFFGITKGVLADVDDAERMDWSFIQKHMTRIK